MARIEILKDVPNDQVAAIKASFEAEGANVTVSPQDAKLSTLIAIFPDKPTSVTATAALARGIAKT